MVNRLLFFAAACVLVHRSAAAGADPRLRELVYDAQAVVVVPVKHGTVTDIVLDATESITDIATGLGSDCSKPDATWCIAAQPGGRHIFVKPKTGAAAPNNIAVVTDRRVHSFSLVVVPDRDTRPPVYRLSIVSETAAPRPVALPPELAASMSIPIPAPLPAAEVVAQRLASAPIPLNANYSVAQGRGSEDIVPSLVFDDGRFTYLRFANNREVPAVFHAQADDSESLVNTHMDGDLLVVDRVSRRLVLRAGPAVVGIRNEAFDVDGVSSVSGTTVPRVDRIVREVAR